MANNIPLFLKNEQDYANDPAVVNNLLFGTKIPVPPQKAPEKKAELTSITKRRGVTAPKGGPIKDSQATKVASTSEEAPSVEKSSIASGIQEITDAIDKKGMTAGDEATAKLFQTILPTGGQFGDAAAMAKISSLLGLGSDPETQQDADLHNRQANTQLFNEALRNYREKRENPFYNVDVEQIDRGLSAILGKEKTGAKNISPAVNEFNLMLGALKNRQDYQQTGSKLASGFLENLIKPVAVATVQKAVPPPRAGNPFAAQNAALGQAKFDADLENKMSTEISKITKPQTEADQRFEMIDEGFRNGDIQSVNTVLQQFSRAVAGQRGVLTDKDIRLIDPSSIYKTFGELEAYFSKTPTARLDPKYTKILRGLTELARTRTREKNSADFEQKVAGWGAKGSQYQRIMGPDGPGTGLINSARALFKAPPSADAKKNRMQELLNKAKK